MKTSWSRTEVSSRRENAINASIARQLTDLDTRLSIAELSKVHLGRFHAQSIAYPLNQSRVRTAREDTGLPHGGQDRWLKECLERYLCPSFCKACLSGENEAVSEQVSHMLEVFTEKARVSS